MKNIILSIILFIAMIIINAMAIIIPLGGNTTQELSDMYPNLFVPTGLTFSIWSLIYTLLLIGLIQTALLVYKEDSKVLNAQQVKVLSLNFVFNFLWIITWQYQMIELSIVFMLGILVTLIYLANQLLQKKVGIIKPAISIYLGWISVATIANIVAFLVKVQWNAFNISHVIWTIVLMSVAMLLALIYIIKRQDYLYSLVIVWALFGILLKQMSNQVVVASVAGILISIILFVIVVSLFTKNRRV